MTISNRTPRPITILDYDAPADAAPLLTLPAAPRGSVARVESSAGKVGCLTIDIEAARVVPVMSQHWGRVVGLAPAGQPQVVSAIVAAAMQAQGLSLRDVYVPADQVRDDAGRIVGCRGLLRGSDAVPRLGPAPQVVVFGSAVGPHPEQARDLDVAYCGMDSRTALRIATGWAHDNQRGHLPIDLRCMPSTLKQSAGGGAHDVIELPRPQHLLDDVDPLDDDALPIFGAVGWAWRESYGLAAVLRRAERLLELGYGPRSGVGRTPDEVVPMLARTLARCAPLVVLAEEPPAAADLDDGYSAPTVGAARRAWVRLHARQHDAWPRVCAYAAQQRLAGPWRSLPALLGASPSRLREWADMYCPLGSAASGAPHWQQAAGRLYVCDGVLRSDYGPVHAAVLET